MFRKRLAAARQNLLRAGEVFGKRNSLCKGRINGAMGKFAAAGGGESTNRSGGSGQHLQVPVNFAFYKQKITTVINDIFFMPIFIKRGMVHMYIMSY